MSTLRGLDELLIDCQAVSTKVMAVGESLQKMKAFILKLCAFSRVVAFGTPLCSNGIHSDDIHSQKGESAIFFKPCNILFYHH